VRTAIGLLVGWLLAALLVLGMDGRLPVFLAWAVPSSLLVSMERPAPFRR
jgi:hypothetical protein